MYRTFILVCSFVFTLAGCGVSPSRLAPPKVQQSLIIKEAQHIHTYHGWATPAPTDRFIMAGVYKAVKSDERGTYFNGPASCLKGLERPANWKEGDGPVGRPILWMNCGIYLPNDPKKVALVYTIAGNVAPSEQGQPITDSAVVSTTVTQTVAGGATPLQAGIAGGVASGLIAGAIALEEGNFIMSSLEVKREYFVITTP